jgi:hypothetical protein
VQFCLHIHHEAGLGQLLLQLPFLLLKAGDPFGTYDVISDRKEATYMDDEGQNDADRLRFWIDRLGEFISSLDEIDGNDPFDFCENAADAWQNTVSSGAPPPTSPAILVVVETFRAVAQVMSAATMDYHATPDARDRMTRAFAQGSLHNALDGVRRDGERWLSEVMPSGGEIKQRSTVVRASLKAALDAGAKRMAEDDADDAAAAADPYGAILGYHQGSGVVD